MTKSIDPAVDVAGRHDRAAISSETEAARVAVATGGVGFDQEIHGASFGVGFLNVDRCEVIGCQQVAVQLRDHTGVVRRSGFELDEARE